MSIIDKIDSFLKQEVKYQGLLYASLIASTLSKLKTSSKLVVLVIYPKFSKHMISQRKVELQ